ncbi:MAG: DUF6456 domain-containing protein [Pseudomonadota bacterium]
MTKSIKEFGTEFPLWLPDATRQYLEHVILGQSIREIARRDETVASTVARRVRQMEARRDDPLVDDGLTALSSTVCSQSRQTSQKESAMNASVRPPVITDERIINREARRILRRLCETGALLVLASDMEKAVVLRPGPDGEQTRTAVVDRAVAIAFGLRDWIQAVEFGRIAKYRITSAGKSALKRLIEEDRQRRVAEGRAPAFAEAQTTFQAQHRDWGERGIKDDDGKRRSIRVNLAETPLASIARRKGTDGKPFLSPDLVQVGEKLREDFERAQMGPRIGQNWDRFLSGVDRGGFLSDGGIGEGPRAARERVSHALDALGPGLSDIVMRVCCFLEGLESAEKRLGWSARSGKIVLKIGLQRLQQHYAGPQS